MREEGEHFCRGCRGTSRDEGEVVLRKLLVLERPLGGAKGQVFVLLVK